jgi:hypothetical protein
MRLSVRVKSRWEQEIDEIAREIKKTRGEVFIAADSSERWSSKDQAGNGGWTDVSGARRERISGSSISG